MTNEHPCNGCPAIACRGVIACPVAGAVLNKGRCRRVKAMSGPKAFARLAGASLQRWNAATATGDRPVLAFLRWHSSSREGKVSRLLAGLTGAEQVKTLAAPLVVRPRRRANGGGGSVPDEHVDAVIAAWERNDETPTSGRHPPRRRRASNGPTDAPTRLVDAANAAIHGRQLNIGASPLMPKADGSQTRRSRTRPVTKTT